MKRLIVAVVTSAFVIGGAAAFASASGGPEINSAKATIQLAAAKFLASINLSQHDTWNYPLMSPFRIPSALTTLCAR